jgi:hypothetical protein
MHDKAHPVMKITFTCPGCAAPASVDASAAGSPARCKHCGHRFTIPKPGEPEPEVYALDERVEEAPPVRVISPPQESAYVRSRGEEGIVTARPLRQRPASRSTKRTAGRRRSRSPWRTWLIWAGIGTVVALAAILVFVPNGSLIAGCALMALGSAMVLAGFAVGAYAAFCEDFLYGFLYLLIPLYTAYYMITRWDDLWVWFACSTAGVALVWLGTELARWGGVVV